MLAFTLRGPTERPSEWRAAWMPAPVIERDAVELVSGNALLAAGHQVDGLKHPMERDAAMPEHGGDLHGELLAASAKLFPCWGHARNRFAALTPGKAISSALRLCSQLVATPGPDRLERRMNAHSIAPVRFSATAVRKNGVAELKAPNR